jgi:transcription initiation factor TFIIF subunit alpha
LLTWKQSDSDSDSDDDETKKEEDKDKDGKDKVGASGTSSKGNNTPQGKKGAADAVKKGKSLKRPGSPMVSDSSGTESTRKNKKKKVGPSTSSLGGSRSTTPMPGGLPRRPGAGSGSDGEATGAEMSDGAGGKKKKKKSRTHLGTGTGAKGTPVGSRAGSPAPPASGSALSPPRDGASTPRSSASGAVTAQEIIDALPDIGAEGISIGAFLQRFSARVGDGPGQMPKGELIQLVKANANWDAATKKLSRKKT